jgi:hypothetical protein
MATIPPQFSVALDTKLRRMLDREARRQRVSRATIIRNALVAYLTNSTGK